MRAESKTVLTTRYTLELPAVFSDIEDMLATASRSASNHGKNVSYDDWATIDCKDGILTLTYEEQP